MDSKVRETTASGASTPLLEVDWANFDPWRIQAVRHRLSSHPLLQARPLVDLGARLEATGSIRTHAGDATAGTSFNHAPDLHPNTKSAVQTIGGIADADAWMSLLNVQVDPIYRELVGTVLDSIHPHVELRDPGMCHRAGWIFVSSANTVTPFHFDKEHNFILQIHGHKRVYVWDHRDTVAASEQARDRFHDCHDRSLLQWREELRSRARVFELGPGQGAYMPSTSPHMVENGDAPSVTVSFTYYTDSTRKDALLHKLHALVRQARVTLPPVGYWPLLDALSYRGVTAALAAKRAVRRMAGQSVVPGCTHFAQVPGDAAGIP